MLLRIAGTTCKLHLNPSVSNNEYSVLSVYVSLFYAQLTKMRLLLIFCMNIITLVNVLCELSLNVVEFHGKETVRS